MTVKHIAQYKKVAYSTVASGTSVNLMVLSAPRFNIDLPTSFTYTYVEANIKLSVEGWSLQSTYGSHVDLIYTCRWNGTNQWLASPPIVSGSIGMLTGGGSIVFSNSTGLNTTITIPITYTSASQQLDIVGLADINVIYSS